MIVICKATDPCTICIPFPLYSIDIRSRAYAGEGYGQSIRSDLPVHPSFILSHSIPPCIFFVPLIHLLVGGIFSAKNNEAFQRQKFRLTLPLFQHNPHAIHIVIGMFPEPRSLSPQMRSMSATAMMILSFVPRGATLTLFVP